MKYNSLLVLLPLWLPGADTSTVEAARLRLTGTNSLAPLRSRNRIERIDDE
ncbi:MULTISPECIES: hypothetical protein [unclassified Pseudomonas]|jgi:hypothetical protein|uniref:hypothetical protein n=1 Tax=unclassified Pseudomonas TaxID=196821 RepID=UPI000D45735B|nr:MULTISPECIES: hypothetical protein [unclassified Pseudomonas]PTR23221.1 hypothetical protein C8K63_108190 [Pseudomonas sp. GV085]